jgi:branched-chain amino acid transport system ATP-binding protein
MTDGGRLDIRGLEVRYGPVTALRGVDLTLEAGTCTLLLGANGAGKSSLLKAVAGLVPFRGTVTYEGAELPRDGRRGNARRRISLVPEGRGTLNALSVTENLRLGAYIRRDRDVEADIEQWLDFFPALRQRVKQKAGSLSGGEQQMLALARAMMSRPRMLLLDEPSMGLAPAVADVIFQRISDLVAGGLTALIVEQNLARAIDMVSSVYVLSLGDVTVRTTPTQLAEDGATRERLLDYL